MIKQNLFKAQCKDNNMWVFGSLIEAGHYCCILEFEEMVLPMDYPYLNAELGTIDGKATPVKPETVCQYVNREDLRDQPIYEGDIVKVYRRHVSNTQIPIEVAVVADRSCLIQEGGGRWFPQDTVDIEVIGNVFDNPELLGERTLLWVKNHFLKGEET